MRSFSLALFSEQQSFRNVLGYSQLSVFLVTIMAHRLSESRAVNIRKVIDQTTANQNKLPGVVAAVVSKDGEIMFSHASGTKGCNSKEPMTLDSVFWIASCTKLIGGIAVMQLCEQGKLLLDNPGLVDKVAPELKNVRILKRVDENGKPEYVDKTKRITLRMLLTHTGKPVSH